MHTYTCFFENNIKIMAKKKIINYSSYSTVLYQVRKHAARRKKNQKVSYLLKNILSMHFGILTFQSM